MCLLFLPLPTQLLHSNVLLGLLVMDIFYLVMNPSAWLGFGPFPWSLSASMVFINTIPLGTRSGRSSTTTNAFISVIICLRSALSRPAFKRFLNLSPDISLQKIPFSGLCPELWIFWVASPYWDQGVIEFVNKYLQHFRFTPWFIYWYLRCVCSFVWLSRFTFCLVVSILI